jgi:Vitamin B12 dependent methionine synthase, activation domain
MLTAPLVLEWSAPAPPQLDPDLVLRLNGYRRPGEASPAVREAARAMAALAARLSAPRVWLRRCALNQSGPEGIVRLREGTELRSCGLARLLRGAHDAVAMLLTIGPGLGRRTQELMARQDVLEALMLDTAGTLAVHEALRDLRRHLTETAAGEGCRLTARLAPGYADWPLTEQRTLFALFNRPGLEIELSDAGLLLPMKSVSGIYGLVPAGSQR